MQHPAVQQYVRVIVNAGHGLSNDTPGIFDQGASSCYGSEHEIVARIADEAVDSYYLARDANLSPTTNLTVIPTPVCSQACIPHHRRRRGGWAGHLDYLVRYINENALHDKRGYHDYILSLHMNWAERAEASGTLVVYDNGAPRKRAEEAAEIARVVAAKLGLPSRGAMPDTETYRKSIAIVEDTDPPALLIELGFVTNEGDVKAVRECGVEAVKAAIETIRGFR